MDHKLTTIIFDNSTEESFIEQIQLILEFADRNEKNIDFILDSIKKPERPEQWRL